MKPTIPKGGKFHIIEDITATGVSAGKAAKALNAVLDAWKLALWCGEEVEVPGGILQAKITRGRPRAKLQHFQNISTKELIGLPVRYPGRRRVVKLKPDPKLGLKPTASK